MESISSMKIIQGAFSLALENRSRTRLAPTPSKSSTNSDADIERKGTPDSPAIALANNVFPVPGGPIRRTPLGTFAPRFSNFLVLSKMLLPLLIPQRPQGHQLHHRISFLHHQ